MFVRRLVTGVRSSCEASATSWRWACTESSSALTDCSSASSIALKLLARRPISSSPAGLMRPLRSWVRATCSVARVRRLSGSTAAPATSRPSSAASAMPPTTSSARIRRRRRAGCRLRSAAGRAGRRGRCRTARRARAGGCRRRRRRGGTARRRARRARACARRRGATARSDERARIAPVAPTSCW